MPQKPNKLSQFWQELKRRRVIHVITVYATSTFVLIELVGNLSEPLNLPERFSTIVIVVLAIGFPLVVILSWLYDLTSEGVEKTKPLSQIKEGEKRAVPNAWKIATYVSFVVIVGLAVLNILGGGKPLRAGDIQSLLILPFENYTGDDQFDMMVSGMHAMLINDIGRISEVRVFSKTTSDVYKDVDLTIPQIASERKADALIETAVLCWGDTICFQMKAVTPDEEQLWIAEYKVDKSQILNLNNEITRQISDEIKIDLTPEEERLFAKSRNVDREAYDAYLMSSFYWDDFTEESLNKAREYLNSAVEKDPGWAPLYSGLAKVWIGIAQAGYESPSISYQKVHENLNKAIELDPDLADAHYLSAMRAYLNEWNWEKGEKEFLKALAINPNDAFSRIYYGQLLYILQRPDEAATQAQLAFDLDPLNPIIQVTYSAALLCAGDCETPLTLMDKLLEEDPEYFFAYGAIEPAAFRCEEFDKAFEATKHLMGVYIDADALKSIERIYEEQGFTAAYEELIRKMEIVANDDYIPAFNIAIMYIMVNQHEKALDWIEKAFDERDPIMPYITTKLFSLDPLFDNPRFIDIVEKMNLPLPED